MKTITYRFIMLLILLLTAACNDEETLMIAGGGIGGTGSPEGTAPVAPGGGAPLIGDIAMKTSISPLNVGPITQVNPLIVNGTTYDTQNALIFINDEQMSLDNLKVGMIVKVEGDKDDSLKTGVAQTVTFSEMVRGPIQAIEQDALIVLGQRVQVDSWTALDGFQSLNELKMGQWVGVSGLTQTAQEMKATYLVLIPEAPLAQVKGWITQLDPVTQTFMLGNLVVDYRALQLLTGDINEGQFATIKGQWLDQQLVADYLTIEPGPLGLLGEGTLLEFHGIVNEVNPPETFSLSDLAVLTTTETLFVDGTSEDIGIGERVTVRGHIDSEGRLVGEEVRFFRE